MKKKLARKVYTCNDLICDMTNSRKIFFPIMLGNERVADIYYDKPIEDSKEFFMVTIKNTRYISHKTALDIIDILSQITSNNEIQEIDLEELHYTVKKFSKHRRKYDFPIGFNHSHRIADPLAILSSLYSGYYNIYAGKYTSIYSNGVKIIDKDSCKMISDLGVNIKYYKSLLPSIIFDKDVNISFEDGHQIYVDDIDSFKNITLTLSSHNAYIYGVTFKVTFLFNREQLDKHEKIILPKIILDERIKRKGIELHFCCINGSDSLRDSINVDYIEIGEHNKEPYNKIKFCNGDFIKLNKNSDNPQNTDLEVDNILDDEEVDIILDEINNL